jgi:DnaJ-class molecular chaperone
MAARNPYDVLGVSRSAGEDEIRRAFRKLAKEFHPDRNAGNPTAEARFKEINAAYGIVGDADLRRKFDAGEIDADGNPRAPAGFGGFGQGARGGARGFQGADVEDLLAGIFGGMRGGQRGFGGFSGFGGFGGAQPQPQGPTEIEADLEVEFVDAVRGGSQRMRTPDGRTIDLKIPPGTGDGRTLRIRGRDDGADLIVRLRVRPHPAFRRDGDDVLLDLPVTLTEAVEGAKVTVPTVDGSVAMTVPRGASSGRMLRLRGKGVPRADGTRGDQLVTLRVVLPETPDPDLEAFVAGWKGRDYGAKREA